MRGVKQDLNPAGAVTALIVCCSPTSTNEDNYTRSVYTLCVFTNTGKDKKKLER